MAFLRRRASIRQSVDSNEITTITRMRVPGGDITQRVEVIPWGGQSVTKLEFFNETPIPVAISIMLLNFGPLRLIPQSQGTMRSLSLPLVNPKDDNKRIRISRFN